MAKRNEVYKCEICGNIVEVLQGGAGELVCCGEPMQLLQAKTEDEGREKHVPLVIDQAHGVLVKVGDVPHPMVDKHFIQWIEIVTPQRVYREYLSPEQEPQAEFCVSLDQVVLVREYCNLHGLWETTV